jgi:D-alanyl-D-alanine carboxypeptidase
MVAPSSVPASASCSSVTPVAPLRSAPPRFASPRSASLRSAPFRLAKTVSVLVTYEVQGLQHPRLIELRVLFGSSSAHAPIDQLYRERISEPLGLKGTSFPGADPSIPDPHTQGYTLQGQSSGGEPVDATNWNPSPYWTAGEMISTVEDLLVYGRALGTGEGLLPSKQQAERLDSLVSDVPPLNQPPLKGNLAYGIGLANEHGWIGHNGETPGYNTYLFYHPDLDAVVAVEVNSDISSGDCPSSKPTMKEEPRDISCHLPAERIFSALAEALGKPAPWPSQS